MWYNDDEAGRIDNGGTIGGLYDGRLLDDELRDDELHDSGLCEDRLSDDELRDSGLREGKLRDGGLCKGRLREARLRNSEVRNSGLCDGGSSQGLWKITSLWSLGGDLGFSAIGISEFAAIGLISSRAFSASFPIASLLADFCVKFSKLLTTLSRSLATWFDSESEGESSSSARLGPHRACWSICWYLRLNFDCPVSRKPFANGLLSIFNFVMPLFCKNNANAFSLDAIVKEKLRGYSSLNNFLDM